VDATNLLPIFRFRDYDLPGSLRTVCVPCPSGPYAIAHISEIPAPSFPESSDRYYSTTELQVRMDYFKEFKKADSKLKREVAETSAVEHVNFSNPLETATMNF
jgi:hypothetical protein